MILNSMAKAPVPLRPENLTPEMMIHHLLEDPNALKQAKKIAVLLMDDEEEIEVWTSDLKNSDLALMALKMTDLAHCHMNGPVDYIEEEPR